MRENLVVTSANVHPYRFWGREEESQDNPTGKGGGVENAIFSLRESRGAFGQPAFFLAGNRMTTVAFETEVFI